MFLTRNKGIHFHDIINNPDLPWHLNEIDLNPNITIDIIIKNPYLKWSKDHISYNKMTNDYYSTDHYRTKYKKYFMKTIF